MDLILSTHSIALPATPQEWVEVLPAGTYAGRDGRGPYTTDPAAVLAAFSAYGMPVQIDYHHQSLSAAEKVGLVPAAGWFQELHEREGAVYGRPEWTARAVEAIAAREILYLSPVFWHDKQGRVVVLDGAGLTNTPNLYLDAVAHSRRAGPLCAGAPRAIRTAHSEKRMDDILEEVCWWLNLPRTTTVAEAAGHLNKLRDQLLAGAAAMGQTAQARLPEVLAAVPSALQAAAQSQSHAAIDLSQYVPRGEFERLSQSLHSIQAERGQAQVDALVAQALDPAGPRIAPASEGWLRAYAAKDLEGARQFVASAPVLALHTAVGPSGTPGRTDGDLTQEAASQLARQIAGVKE